MREFERGQMSWLRVWTAPDAPAGIAPADVCVEWAARPGHPSSYGLLGGHLGAAPSDRDVWPTGQYPQSLTGRSDDVEFGLPQEYLDAVEAVRGELVVTVAAHGRVGSSTVVFRRLASVLIDFLTNGIPVQDAEVWRAWDRT
jgi:hypothetical protein